MVMLDEALLIVLAFYWYVVFVLWATPTEPRVRSAAGPRKVGLGKEKP